MTLLDGVSQRSIRSKQVLTKILVEVEILDTFKSTRLNPLFLCDELKEGIRRNNDLEALAAFNCFR